MEEARYPSVILDDTEYEDEAILPQRRKEAAALPPLLASARALAEGDFPASRQEIFLRQGRLLADYADDYRYTGDPVRYYPTYQSLTDEELRGYFSWRPKVRARQVEYAPLTFIFLYIYELINCIGVESAEEAYEQLLFLKRSYSTFGWAVSAYLDRWIPDFVVYYDLAPALLADSTEKVYNRCIHVLENMDQEPRESVLDAVKQIAPKWLGRSRFYAAHFEDMDEVIYTVLKGMAAHYAAGCKRSLVDQLFGARLPGHMHIFSQAIFCNPLGRKNYQYTVDGMCVYSCENGIWTSKWRPVTSRSGRKLEAVLKTIDQMMREEYAFGHPIKGDISHRWILKLITETTQALLAKKAEAEKNRIRIDFSLLNKIRSDADIIREKLVTEDDVEPDAPAMAPPPEAATPPAAAPAGLPQLSGPEARFLACQLQGGDTGWLRVEGLMPSVLADAINEKLYDLFGDTVLDADGRPVADYVDELKEMLSI
ncbi:MULTISPECIES: TerB N-terminal domain-containing protein [unclassified Desulfovibrio]|uniref:TerB N-terminal domain-containing protein n=1 Tax=unclassified Desulfovibrio TaxID=2593640 RepID=UPI0013E9D4D7|nr:MULTISPECIES: TerB N-terminal domain-containing protein [unclassified Desulfovibrio]